MDFSKVVRGQFTLTLGFQLGGRIEKQHLSTDQILERLNSTPMKENSVMDHQIVHIGKRLPDWGPSLPKSSYTSEIHEYVPKSKQESHDELSLRLFIRKSDLLTSKGRSGLTSVKLLELDNVDFSEIAPQNRDEGTKEHSRIILTNGHPSGVELVEPETNRSHWKANLQVVLHLQSSPVRVLTKNRNSQRKTQVAALSIIIGPQVDPDLTDFFAKTDHLMLDLDNLAATNKENQNIFDEIKRVCEYYLTSGRVSLLTFAIGLSWSIVIRKILSSATTTRNTDFTQAGKEFVRDLHELRNALSFQYKEVVLDHLPDLSDRNLSNLDWLKFVTLMIGYSEGLAAEQMAYVARNGVELTPNTYFVSNRGLYLMDAKEHPGSLFLHGRLDYSEWGERWGSTWSILMSVMLCLLAQIFILYNEEEEAHVSEGREALELRDLTKSAVEDFGTYYDIDIIQSHLYKEEFETAKETFGINRYYDILTTRLELFSEYEIAAENIKSNKRIEWLTVAIGVLTVVVGILSVFR